MDRELHEEIAADPHLSEELSTVFYQIAQLLFVAPSSEILQDLPLLQIRLLRNIGEAPGQKVADLAPEVGLSVSRISRLLTALENRGLIERVPDRQDKRIVRIYLHEVAKAALRERETQRVERMEQCLRQMSPDNAVKLVESLHLFKRAVEKSAPGKKS